MVAAWKKERSHAEQDQVNDSDRSMAEMAYEAWRKALSGWGEIPEFNTLSEKERFRWQRAAEAVAAAQR
jgi:hypothetical protein